MQQVQANFPLIVQIFVEFDIFSVVLFKIAGFMFVLLKSEEF